MRRCLQLAALGAGRVAPNPMVGAVLVHEGRIISEGYHEQYGGPHAEVNCLNRVPRPLRHLVPQSTLYVSLEPCNHFGKTPPCSDLIIEYNIPKVVVACRDAYEKVNGSGIKKLRDHGIEVIEGVLESEALFLNRRFFCFHAKQRPYIILKWAQSADGFIAGDGGKRVSISNGFTNRLVHKWRTEEAAIAVGTKTALNDDPFLTTRLWPGPNPVRIVIDKHLLIPESHHIFDQTSPTIILNHVAQREEKGLSLYQTKTEDDTLTVMMNLMYERRLTSLIVEGGARLLQSFMDAGVWDEARIITNRELYLRQGIAAPVLLNAKRIGNDVFADDEIVYYASL